MAHHVAVLFGLPYKLLEIVIIIIGDIAVSEKTVDKLMKTTAGSNSTFIQKAYPDSGAALWNETFVNGKYIIAYEMNPGLGYTLQRMIPEVRF